MRITQWDLHPRWIKIELPDGTGNWINTAYIEQFGAVGKATSWVRMAGDAFDIPVAVPYSDLVKAIINYAKETD